MTEAKEEVQTVKLVEVVPLPYNVSGRLESELDQMLRTDMGRAEKGLYKIDPILVRRLIEEEIQKYKEKNPWAKYMLVDGYKRWEAARELGWHNIRAIITDMTLDEALEFNYKKNKIRGTVDPLKEAIYFRYLTEVRKIPAEKIADNFGMSIRRVYQIFSRLKGVEPLKKIFGESAFTSIVRNKKIEPWHLEILGSVEEPKKQEELAKLMIEAELSGREAEVAREAVEKGLPPEKTVKLLKKAKHEKLTPKEAKVVVEAIAKKPEVETLLELPKPKLVEEAKKIITPPPPPPSPEEIRERLIKELEDYYPPIIIDYAYTRYKGEHLKEVIKASIFYMFWEKLTEAQREEVMEKAMKEVEEKGKFVEPVIG
jgi:ParB family chromosome partitioning protein